jgi:hypothetical protein
MCAHQCKKIVSVPIIPVFYLKIFLLLNYHAISTLPAKDSEENFDN